MQRGACERCDLGLSHAVGPGTPARAGPRAARAAGRRPGGPGVPLRGRSCRRCSAGTAKGAGNQPPAPRARQRPARHRLARLLAPAAPRLPRTLRAAEARLCRETEPLFFWFFWVSFHSMTRWAFLIKKVGALMGHFKHFFLGSQGRPQRYLEAVQSFPGRHSRLKISRVSARGSTRCLLPASVLPASRLCPKPPRFPPKEPCLVSRHRWSQRAALPLPASPPSAPPSSGAESRTPSHSFALGQRRGGGAGSAGRALQRQRAGSGLRLGRCRGRIRASCRQRERSRAFPSGSARLTQL